MSTTISWTPEQTAVQWLREQIQSEIMADHIGGEPMWTKETLLEMLEQAEVKEQELLTEAHDAGHSEGYSAAYDEK